MNDVEVDVFWNSFAFSMIKWMLAIWSLVSLPFLNPGCTSGSSWFTFCWSLAWRILTITLLVCEMSAIVWQFEHPLVLPFFGIRMKTDLFQSCGHCWVFQICWYIEWSTLTASSFRIWKGSAGIPSPPLALFIVMIPKAYLILHSRMSGCRWVITPSWLSGSWRSFLYSEGEVAQSCLNLCDPWTVAHRVPLSMGFSRQEHWSGLPFPSPMHESE